MCTDLPSRYLPGTRRIHPHGSKRLANAIAFSDIFIAQPSSCCPQCSLVGDQQLTTEAVGLRLDVLGDGSTTVERHYRFAKLVLKQNMSHLVRDAGQSACFRMNRVLDDQTRSPKG